MTSLSEVYAGDNVDEGRHMFERLAGVQIDKLPRNKRLTSFKAVLWVDGEVMAMA